MIVRRGDAEMQVMLEGLVGFTRRFHLAHRTGSLVILKRTIFISSYSPPLHTTHTLFSLHSFVYSSRYNMCDCHPDFIIKAKTVVVDYSCVYTVKLSFKTFLCYFHFSLRCEPCNDTPTTRK